MTVKTKQCLPIINTEIGHIPIGRSIATRVKQQYVLVESRLSSLLFKKINLFYFEANYFTILWWFCPYIDMNQPWVYKCPPILNLPPTSLPVVSAPALSALLPALNLHWSSILHVVIYMFQCYSLKSSHSCLLPQSPKSVVYISSLLLSCI